MIRWKQRDFLIALHRYYFRLHCCTFWVTHYWLNLCWWCLNLILCIINKTCSRPSWSFYTISISSPWEFCRVAFLRNILCPQGLPCMVTVTMVLSFSECTHGCCVKVKYFLCFLWVNAIVGKLKQSEIHKGVSQSWDYEETHRPHAVYFLDFNVFILVDPMISFIVTVVKMSYLVRFFTTWGPIVWEHIQCEIFFHLTHKINKK